MKPNWLKIKFVIGVLTLLIIMVACNSTPEPTPSSSQSEMTLTLSGSGGGGTILQAAVAPFTEAQNDVTLDFLPGSGGSASKDGVAEGILDIGILLSSDIESEQRDGITVLPLGEDPLAFVVHPNLTVDNLTTEQLQAIYNGNITNWQEVGGPNANIAVLTRNEDEASTIILRKVLFGDAPFVASTTTLNKAGEMRTAVTEIPNSIGFMSYGDFVTRDLAANVIAVNDVTPAAYDTGNYPFPARTLAIVYNPNNRDQVTPLLTYLEGETAKETLSTLGLVPLIE